MAGPYKTHEIKKCANGTICAMQNANVNSKAFGFSCLEYITGRIDKRINHKCPKSGAQ